MSEGTLFAYICVVASGLLTAWSFRWWYNEESGNSYTLSNSIYANAMRDLSLIGEYSYKTTISIRYWLYAIEVAIWKKDSSFNAVHLFRTWNYECNDDFAGFINDGLERAHSTFLAEVEKAREEEREPVFTVSCDYDYHVCPKSLLYSDHVATEELLERVDNLIGGEALG